LADETYEEVLCYVLELTAAGEDALYAKIKMWVRQDEMIPLRVELWDPADTLKKTLTLADFRSVDGELIPHNVVMADNQKGTRTILEITEMDQSAVADEVFTVRYLRR
ncbi:MAG TPA: outer membrane lipoprotein-sorting protein, partial [Firmicutes bacterium]|nr:outer membrane lipoprotein-sorting protein [Bacillota bacterium]